MASRDNVEFARSICEAWERGDYSADEWADPDIEFVIEDGPEPGRWTGLAGMAEGWRTWIGAWENHHQRALEYHALGDERVLVLFRGYGRAKSSGLELSEISPHRAAGLFDIRDGRVTRFAVHLDGERAAAELGVQR
jgi:ketosteroid isomerase-like protein